MHDFHIPVMGLAYTIDSPVRVANYGIDSVVSIIDDELMESMRAYYSKRFKLPYQAITKKMTDYRARRISVYLNLLDSIVKKKFEIFKQELLQDRTSLEKYLKMIAPKAEIRLDIKKWLNQGNNLENELKSIFDKWLCPGKIDVNIMTKVDRENYVGNKKLGVEFNDAHAALRGFATSSLESSVVFSAGMNPRLYSYLATFSDFYPDKNGYLKKKIILKVSDYRSALIQGQFLAKKGLWVSEFRIESGLNCGGHAFASDGNLLGPVLEEFKQRKVELQNQLHESLIKTLEMDGKFVPEAPMNLKISVQGGVGTSEEHQFLTDYFKVDSVGWGSPFLLVPEATLVDTETRELLMKAKEEELYLSNISPLGVPFNTVRNTTNEHLKQKRIENSKAGSSCPKKHLALNYEYANKGQCTASRKFQQRKLNELLSENLNPEEIANKKRAITEKSCLCVGLANPAYIDCEIPVKQEAQGVVVCPGPNMAYFNKEVSLLDMIGHIYGKHDLLKNVNRPNMFVKELMLNFNYFEKELKKNVNGQSVLNQKKMRLFKVNLLKGIEYYQSLFNAKKVFDNSEGNNWMKELNEIKFKLEETSL
ncbi:hypothetical protein SAMN04487906_1937 [Zhouia amylolytica]|uniref:Uncharacterized protein n=1 Tax=Zhouia amylolytica TaxID=376730 RepID=A0A1I6TAE5_9FLAO|nr:hypothetical protein [Zhouia amylolytica]SFS86083.1 hypothetical protein SAMN04487906_1937 [Zhouia amylolytica]